MSRIGLMIFAAVAALAVGSASADSGRIHFENGEYDAAVAAWTPLAERGDRWAMVGLGHVASIRGDAAGATRWYHGAAIRGHVVAQTLLASAYLEGRGVARDPALAYAWYHLAAENGHAKAAEARDLAARWLGPDRPAEIRAMVRRWRIDGMPAAP